MSMKLLLFVLVGLLFAINFCKFDLNYLSFWAKMTAANVEDDDGGTFHLPAALKGGDFEVAELTKMANDFVEKHGLATCHDILEFLQAWSKYRYEPDPSKQEEFLKTFRVIACPYYLSKLNAVIKEKNDGVGEEFYADSFLVVVLQLFEETVDQNLLDDYPALIALKTILRDSQIILPSLKPANISFVPSL